MLNDPNMLVILGGASLLLAVQLGVALFVFLALRMTSKDVARLNREMFGLVKKLEGLTASRREQILKQYDQMLQVLSARIPPTIAQHTSNVIFEAESKILARLAELEPNLKGDEAGRRKMDELIASMESLEKTIVTLAADTVRQVMAESRRNLFDDDNVPPVSLAA